MLPKITLPIFEIALPAAKQKIKMRPFTVKEEKILLSAKEGKDVGQMILAVKQILENCIVEGIALEKMPITDVEYALIQLRSRSVDNSIEFIIKDPDTDQDVKLKLDLDTIQVKIPEGHTNNIKLDDTKILVMAYPTLEDFELFIKKGFNDEEANTEVLIRAMSKIIDGDEVIDMADMSSEEKSEWLDGLPGDVLKSIRNFFSTAPVLSHSIKYKDSTGKEKTFVLEGLQSFFIY